jgi:hypothetical protein
METPVTWTQLIIACIFILVTTLAPQIYQIYNRRLEAREKERQEKMAAKQLEEEREAKSDDKVWDRVVTEYERALDQRHALEEELKQLRPLALQNAVLQQKCQQTAEDKEDWKAHAMALEEQLTASNIIPRPFRRLVRTEENTDRLKTISTKMKTIKDEHVSAATDSPTLVFPKEGA